MHIFSYLNRLVQKSITDNEIQLDDKSFERLDNELSLIEEEDIAYHFILNHRVNTISRKLSMAAMPEYGAVSAWYINYCLGISMINPLYRSRRVQQFYQPLLGNLLPLFKPVSEQHQKTLISELKQEIDKNEKLKNYSELNAKVLSNAIVGISAKSFFHSMILEQTRRISGRLAGVKEEIIANENQVGGFEFLKYDIFNASFIGVELFETALTNLNDNRLNQDEKVRNKLSHIMTHSFMNNLNFIVNNGEFLKMSTEDLYKYSLLTITSMKNAIRQLDKNVSI